MKFDLIRFGHRQDFGDEYYFQFVNVKFKKSYWSLLQLSVSWNDTPGWPYLQMTFGSNGFFSILFWIYAFGFDLDLFSRTWKFDFLKKLDELEQ